jgi:folate-binding protein YgfZ
MTETDLAITIQATALAELLESAHRPYGAGAYQLCAYRGALTPRELDAPEKETAALAFGAAVHDLGWLRRVAVRGEDRFRWLSGMVTNSVTELAPNAGAWNLVLNAQGRIQGDLTVWRAGDELELEIAADQHEKLLTHLNHFIIMDDVELVPLGGEQAGEAGSETAVGLTGPLAGEVLGRMGLPAFADAMTAVRVEWNGLDLRIARGYGVLAAHYELWVPSAGLVVLWAALRTAGAALAGSASLDAFRIAEGIPSYGIDMVERDLPQETSQMRALHFNKGCYLGQEIVERIHSRGGVHRHLRPLELTGPVPTGGTELTLEDGAAAGQITSAAAFPLAGGSRFFALGMVRGEAELSPQRQGSVAGEPGLRNQPFTYTAGTATGTARILTVPPTLAPERAGSAD